MNPAYAGLASHYQKVQEALASQRGVRIPEVSDFYIRTFLASLLYQKSHARYILVLPTEKELASWASFISLLCSESPDPVESCVLPLLSFWGSERNFNKTEGWLDRLAVFEKWNTVKSPLVVCTTLPALLQKGISSEALCHLKLSLHVGEEVELETFLVQLQQIGYYETSRVETRGTYSVRGGIVDLYSLQDRDPLRFEFLGDQLQAIRRFSLHTQLSIEKIDEVDVGCANEIRFPLSKEKVQSFYEFLLQEDVKKTDRERIIDTFSHASSFPHGEEVFVPFFISDPKPLEWQKEKDVLIFPCGYDPCLEFAKRFFYRVEFDFSQDRERHLPTLSPDFHFLPLTKWNGSACSIVFGSCETQAGFVKIPFSSQIFEATLSGWGEGIHNWLASVEGVLRKTRVSLPVANPVKVAFSSALEVEEGDLIVHFLHGVGKYLGLSQLAVHDVIIECIMLEYHGGDKVYVPVDRIGFIQKYTGGAEGSLVLDRLRSQNWVEKKARAQKAIENIADALLETQANRELAEPNRYPLSSVDYEQFVADFPYEETSDQLQALSQIEEDLQKDHPMDRLIIGDVGFGKTEIAMRAMMRVILDHHQVLVIVPTTLLCYQHYHSFRSRFERYGVSVASMSRLVPLKKRREILVKMNEGKIDILVGTHGVLTPALHPPRLGLVVVDEEQKFGVLHKEKWKALAPEVDFLMLSATPIPRSLHMALSGLREISILASPPMNRLAVKTAVVPFSETLFRSVVELEIRRGGQLFFIHHRVQDIYQVAAFLQQIVPDVKMQVAHGQMPEAEMEKIFLDFVERRFSLLISTTIIESGMDLPNVNTLLVNHAEHFGLSQLYQLRGRVGRSGTQAYAYFMPSQKMLTEEAQKRLATLEAHQELGAGFYIAKADLEIRGAGNLLGSQQSGHVTSIGLDLYTEMLYAEIQRRKGKVEKPPIDPEISLPVSAVIPVAYMPSESQRLILYKKIFSLRSEEEIDRIQSELEDRYGKIELPVATLLQMGRIRFYLKCLGVERLWREGSSIQVCFSFQVSLPAFLRGKAKERVVLVCSYQEGEPCLDIIVNVLKEWVLKAS